MSEETLLAALLAQAREDGADIATLRGLIEEASTLGARRAIAELGLADEHAGRDVRDLRELLKAWRDVKTSTIKAVAGWLVRVLLALIVLGVTVKLGFMEQLR